MKDFPVATKIYDKKQERVKLFNKIQMLNDQIDTLSDVAEPIVVFTSHGYYGFRKGLIKVGTLEEVLSYVELKGWRVSENEVRWVVFPTPKEEAAYKDIDGYANEPFVGVIHVRTASSGYYEDALELLMAGEKR